MIIDRVNDLASECVALGPMWDHRSVTACTGGKNQMSALEGHCFTIEVPRSV